MQTVYVPITRPTAVHAPIFRHGRHYYGQHLSTRAQRACTARAESEYSSPGSSRTSPEGTHGHTHASHSVELVPYMPRDGGVSGVHLLIRYTHVVETSMDCVATPPGLNHGMPTDTASHLYCSTSPYLARAPSSGILCACANVPRVSATRTSSWHTATGFNHALVYASMDHSTVYTRCITRTHVSWAWVQQNAVKLLRTCPWVSLLFQFAASPDFRYRLTHFHTATPRASRCLCMKIRTISRPVGCVKVTHG